MPYHCFRTFSSLHAQTVHEVELAKARFMLESECADNSAIYNSIIIILKTTSLLAFMQNLQTPSVLYVTITHNISLGMPPLSGQIFVR